MRVVTPGTVSDEAFMDSGRDNLLVVLHPAASGFGLASLDMSSGRFSLMELADTQEVQAELERLRPAELLIPDTFNSGELCLPVRGVRKRPIWEFELEQARRQLCQHFAVRDLIGFGCDDAARALCRRRRPIPTPKKPSARI